MATTEESEEDEGRVRSLVPLFAVGSGTKKCTEGDDEEEEDEDTEEE